MKATRFNTLTKNIFLGIFTMMIAFSFVSCARNFNFITSSVVPAARGNVKVTEDKNKNYVILVQIQNLTEVERLQPSKKTYIVWMVTDQEITKNIGQLNSSTSLFSKQLKATLKTVSSTKPIKIFITAEDDASVQYPGSQILSTNRF